VLRRDARGGEDAGASVVCPPPAGNVGAWRSEPVPGGTASRFLDPENHLLGFALTGTADSRKQ
jgi:hypothetical protein